MRAIRIIHGRQRANRDPCTGAATRPATQRGVTTNQYLAGGTTLIDLMRLNVMRPQA